MPDCRYHSLRKRKNRFLKLDLLVEHYTFKMYQKYRQNVR